MTDDLKDIEDQLKALYPDLDEWYLFDPDIQNDYPVYRISQAFDLFSTKFPEVPDKNIRGGLDLVEFKSLNFRSDYFWNIKVKNPKDGKFHHCAYISAFGVDDVHAQHMPPIKKVTAVTSNICFTEGDFYYTVSLTNSGDLAILKFRFLIYGDMIRELYTPPPGRRVIDCYPMKGYDALSGKYVSVFWCIQLDDGQDVFIPADSRLHSYRVYFYPICRGDFAIFGNYCFRANIEGDDFFFEKQDILVTDKLRAQENVVLEGDPPKDTQAHIIEFKPPNVHPKSQQTAHIIDFNL